MLKYPQTVTIWQATGSDGFGGKAFSAPIQVAARYEAKQELFRNMKGDEFVSRAVIYCDTVINLGDFVANGSYDDSIPVDSAYEVKQASQITNLSGTRIINKAVL